MTLKYSVLQGKEQAVTIQKRLNSLSDKEYPINVNIISDNFKGCKIKIEVADTITNDEILELGVIIGQIIYS